MRVRELCPRPRRVTDLIAAVARARGCETPGEVARFLEPDPPIENALRRLPAYPAARDRLASALGLGQKIVLFGDYDADGITALVQLRRFWRAAGLPDGRVAWFVPDRQRHEYGLSRAAVEECLRLHRPDLLLALDCGSSSLETIAWLRGRGVDVVVLDHHAVAAAGAAHPAVAHLNPAACGGGAVGGLDGPGDRGDRGDLGDLSDLRRMSASGLAYLFCEALAEDLRVAAWDRDAGLLLAAVGTVADVMPLRGTNRALVKRALRLAADGALARLPGLAALHETSATSAIDVRTLGFQWGPRLNAPGRIEDAAHPVDLLLADDLETARPLAQRCQAANRQRQELTRDIEAEALRIASERLREHPAETVLVLGAPQWHPGIVGIVASRLRERFTRPVIVCGGHDDGTWKGSGRSLEGYDLGAEVRAAHEAGLLLRGGGHALAAGLAMEPERLEALRVWLNGRSRLAPDDLVPHHEVLCEAAAVPSEDLQEWCDGPDPRQDGGQLARFWTRVFDLLEPFGAGNPRPALLLRRAELRWGPEPKRRKADQSVWALAAGFACGGSGLLFAEWTDLERAEACFVRGARCDVVCSPTRSPRTGSGPEQYWYGWRVIEAERCA